MRDNKLISASWDYEFGGVLEYYYDLALKDLPRFEFCGEVLDVSVCSGFDFAKNSGYFIEGDEVCFVLENCCESRTYFVCGEFNNWVKRDDFRMRYCGDIGAYKLSTGVNSVFQGTNLSASFKFVSDLDEWIGPNNFSTNVDVRSDGITNFLAIRNRTGKNLFKFRSGRSVLSCIGGRIDIFDENGKIGDFLANTLNLVLKYESNKRLGAFIYDGSTIFRLFAPRASNVCAIFDNNADLKNARRRKLYRDESGVWSVRFLENLKKYFYAYDVDGKIVQDPYSVALVSSNNGPGIIVDDGFFKKEFLPFKTPMWHDLVIVEAHVRDLIKNCDIACDEKLGFSGLTKMLSGDFYLKNIGINAVELQPITEYDSFSRSEYHWGYMPSNYFAPSSNYATDPNNASQIKEFQDLVDAFHKSGIAVIIDVVYNHTGEQNPLAKIDKEYYHNSINGKFTNYSGCGNDLRVSAPMAERLIIDSLISFIRNYNVDGFRFDLAELLGKPLLSRIEVALKREKPDVILIAEPWSFKGHIARDLKCTGWASWNDGYRNFLADYVSARGNYDGIKYFLSGSLSHLSRFPAQSVNYTESHDDMCWIDKISGNRSNFEITVDDELKTRMMFVILMMSLGVPMFSAGQDFLRSKGGLNNTYNNGDVNALDYSMLESRSNFNQYVKKLIKLRSLYLADLLQLEHSPTENFMKFSCGSNSSSILAMYNADNSCGNKQLLLAINPHDDVARFNCAFADSAQFLQILDGQSVDIRGISPLMTMWHGDKIVLPRLSCAAWVLKS